MPLMLSFFCVCNVWFCDKTISSKHRVVLRYHMNPVILIYTYPLFLQGGINDGDVPRDTLLENDDDKLMFHLSRT
jgi:hypothetical protein